MTIHLTKPKRLIIELTIFLTITSFLPAMLCGWNEHEFFADVQAVEHQQPQAAHKTPGQIQSDELMRTMGEAMSGDAESKIRQAKDEVKALLKRQSSAILPLAREVARIVTSSLTTADFSTGSKRFDGEWLFGTYHMAGLGLMQVLKTHPDLPERKAFIQATERCIEMLQTPAVQEFDRTAWNEDPLKSLQGNNGHAAYLGYFNLTLGLYREVVGGKKFRELHQRISEALIRRYRASGTLLMLKTYPGEMYPVDNMAAIASIAQYDRVTQSNHRVLIQRWIENCRARHIDPGSGLLIQAIDCTDGSARDKPRASGTTLGLYLISFADPKFSRQLYRSIQKNCATDWGGFGLVREYPPNVPAGEGDIDSGPVVMGMSFSGTGFCIAGTRLHNDAEFFRKLYRTLILFGAPQDKEGRRHYATGGPLGNAIMLAMLSARCEVQPSSLKIVP